MRLVNAAEMQEIDRRTIAAGTAVAELMERAGSGVAAVAEKLAARPAARIEIVCGKGHNGGDGIVAARLLAARGHRVRVHLTHEATQLAPETRAQFDRLSDSKVEITALPSSLQDPGPIMDPRARPKGGDSVRSAATESNAFGRALASADVCVDALLGTGALKTLQAPLTAIIHWIQHASSRTLSVDIPSGVDATTGAILGTAVWADTTVTFGLPKLGLALEPGRERAGNLIVHELGFPAEIVDAVLSQGTERHWMDAATARRLVPRLDPTAHKYQRGCVVVVAGSRAFPGAAVLAAMAALRSGAGIVHLAAPAGIRPILQTKLTEVIVHELPETRQGTLAADAAEPLARILARADAVALGPGLSAQSETLAFARTFLAGLRVPAVVDADAIAAMPAPPHAAERIVSPHAGELARWMGVSAEEVNRDRLLVARDTAARSGAVVVAKGAPAIIATPDGVLHVNGSGSAALATAGSGDVLTGILAALLARGLAAANAARLGVFLHGIAGELAARKHASQSVIASDLLDMIGPANASID